MALRSSVWFLGMCLQEERRRSRLRRLAGRVLDLGLLGQDKTRGHVTQACGGAQRFFQRYPQHKRTIKRARPDRPYSPSGSMLADWQRFFARKGGRHGRTSFGYDWDTLRSYLTPQYGGTRRGGGGGDNEFEIVLRVLAGLRGT